MSSVHDYDYDLPREQIAQFPLENRADARMLVLERETGRTTHAFVRDLSQWVRPADALVVNNSRVVPARVVGHRTPTGGRFKGLFLAPLSDGRWQLLTQTKAHLKPGDVIELTDAAGRPDVRLTMLEKGKGGVWTALPNVDEPVWTTLDRVGQTPLPCYIRQGHGTPADHERYQTVYASSPGSAAAPTAGLHLTRQLLDHIVAQGTLLGMVTLHVGLDTFRPLQVERLEDHTMHSERCELTAALAAELDARRAGGGRIFAVGTTTARTLESAASSGEFAAHSGPTDLFIRPPYVFRGLDALLTNFHLPRSTLLVLVCTFAGRQRVLDAYAEAVRQGYRFYSYGDAMLIV